MRSVACLLVLCVLAAAAFLRPGDSGIRFAYGVPDSAFDQPHPPQLVCEDSIGAALAPLIANNPRTEGHPGLLREMRMTERVRDMIVVDLRDWDLDHDGGGYVHDRILFEWTGSRWRPTQTMRRFD